MGRKKTKDREAKNRGIDMSCNVCNLKKFSVIPLSSLTLMAHKSGRIFPNLTVHRIEPEVPRFLLIRLNSKRK